MAAIAGAAIVVWLVYLVVGRRAAAGAPARPAGSRWYQYLLAAGLLITLLVTGVLLLIWGLNGAPDDASSVNWRSGDKTTVFVVILAVGAGLALLAFLIAVFSRLPGRAAAASVAAAASAADAAPVYQTPAALRLLGPLLFALLLLCVRLAVSRHTAAISADAAADLSGVAGGRAGAAVR